MVVPEYRAWVGAALGYWSHQDPCRGPEQSLVCGPDRLPMHLVSLADSALGGAFSLAYPRLLPVPGEGSSSVVVWSLVVFLVRDGR